MFVSWALNRSLWYVCGGKSWQGVGSRWYSPLAGKKKCLNWWLHLISAHLISPFQSRREILNVKPLHHLSLTLTFHLFSSPPAMNCTELEESAWPVILDTSFISAFPLTHSFFPTYIHIYLCMCKKNSSNPLSHSLSSFLPYNFGYYFIKFYNFFSPLPSSHFSVKLQGLVFLENTTFRGLSLSEGALKTSGNKCSPSPHVPTGLTE